MTAGASEVMLQYGAIGAILLLCVAAVAWMTTTFISHLRSQLKYEQTSREALITALDRLCDAHQVYQQKASEQRRVHEQNMAHRSELITNSLSEVVKRLEKMNGKGT